MDQKAKDIQKALHHFRFISPNSEAARKTLFGGLTDILRARVSAEPLTALDELSDVYNAILQKKLTFHLDKNPRSAAIQEDLVLHALQTQYKLNLERYLRDLNEKSVSEKKAAITALQNKHAKIIVKRSQATHPINIALMINTLLQATDPRVAMPTTVQHAPSSTNVKWHESKVKLNVINNFIKEYQDNVQKRDEYLAAIERNDRHYSYLDDRGIRQLNAKIDGMLEMMQLYAIDNDPEIKQAAQQALIEAGVAGKVEDKFLHQLLSGYRNPTTLKKDDEAQYSPEDIIKYAHSLLTIMKPEEILDEVTRFYQQASSIAKKKVILQNASILLHELILVDNMQQQFPDFSQNTDTSHPATAAFDKLLAVFKEDIKIHPELRDLTATFEQNIRAASDLTATLKDQAQQQIKTLMHAPFQNSKRLDVESFIADELQNPNIAKRKMNEAAKIVANDFKKIGIAHLINMKSTDLYRQAWSKKNKEQTHYVAFSRFADKISHVVTNDIISAKTQQHQEQIAVFYCRVLEEAIRIHDYSTAFAIYGGLNSTPVFRLKHLNDIKEFSQTVAKAKNILDTTDSDLKKLRTLVENNKDSVVVPYMGMFTKDLTFTDDGISDRDSKTNDINHKKLDILSSIYLKFDHIVKQAKRQKANTQGSTILRKVNMLKVDEKLQDERSLSFRGRTFDLSTTATIAEILAKFPNQQVPKYLEIKLIKNDDSKLLKNKRAYKEILKIIIAQSSSANSIEKAQAQKLINNMMITAKENDFHTKKLDKMLRAAHLMTEVPDTTQHTIDFVKIAAEEFYITQSLKAELEATGDEETAKPLSVKTEGIRDKLIKASKNAEPKIAELAKHALQLIDSMANIPVLSEKYQQLKENLSTVDQGPARLKTLISIQDQMEKIEDQLRSAARHPDPRIKIPAQVALEKNQISIQKPAVKFTHAAPKVAAQSTNKRSALITHHRTPIASSHPSSETTPITVPTRDAPVANVTQTPETALPLFIKDLQKAKNILENFHTIPKYKMNGYSSLQAILKQLHESRTANVDIFHNPKFNISFKEYDKFAALATLEYIIKSLKENPSHEMLDRLAFETSKKWPEGKQLLSHLKEELIAEGAFKPRQNPRAM